MNKLNKVKKVPGRTLFKILQQNHKVPAFTIYILKWKVFSANIMLELVIVEHVCNNATRIWQNNVVDTARQSIRYCKVSLGNFPSFTGQDF